MSNTYICKTQIDVQFSNIWPFLTFSNRRPMMSLSHTSNDATFVRECFWSNDGEGTRPDSKWGVLDDKMYFIVTVDKILLCLGVLLL